MSIILSFIQLITIITICLYEYKKKYISIFMWATLLVMFGIPHFLTVIIGDYLYDDIILYKASIFVITFNILYLITKVAMDSIIKSKQVKNSTCTDIQNTNTLNKRDKLMTFIFFALLMSTLLVLFWVSQKYFGGITNSSWGKFYTLNKELGFNSPVKYADFIFFAVAGVALVFKNYRYKYLFIVSTIIIISYSFITSNRITILPAFMAVIIPIVFNDKQKLTLKKLFYFSVMAAIVIYSVYMLRLVRFAGGVSNFFENFDLTKINTMIFEMLLNGDGELGLRNAFYYFISIDNNFPGFNEGATYIRLFLISIPTRFSFGMKPPDFAITMGSAYSNNIGNKDYSMHPTLYGDVFANLWWIGILLAVFWAVFTNLINILVNRKNHVVRNMLLVLFGTVFVIVGRGSVYNGFFLGFEGSIIIGLMYLITRLRVR